MFSDCIAGCFLHVTMAYAMCWAVSERFSFINTVHKSSLCECTFDKLIYLYESIKNKPEKTEYELNVALRSLANTLLDY